MATNKAEPTVLDIQKVSMRIIETYQRFDAKIPLGSQLISIQRSLKYPDDIFKHFPSPICRTLVANKFTVACVASTKQPVSADNFFARAFDQLSRKEREDIYWRIRLQYGCGLLPIILIRLARKLLDGGNHTHFSCLVKSEKETVAEERVHLGDLVARGMNFVPRELNAVEKVHPFLPAGIVEPIEVFGVEEYSNVATHMVVVCDDKLVVDLSAMQFGLRGASGELVGHPEPVAGFAERFPGDDVVILDSDPEKEKYEYEGLYRMNKKTIDGVVRAVLDDITKNKNWCHYCGKILDRQRLCGSCREAMYCERQCQVLDWKWHKLVCKNLKQKN